MSLFRSIASIALFLGLFTQGTAHAQDKGPGQLFDNYATAFSGWNLIQRCKPMNAKQTIDYKLHLNALHRHLTNAKTQKMLAVMRQGAQETANNAKYSNCGQAIINLTKQSYGVLTETTAKLGIKVNFSNGLRDEYKLMKVGLALSDRCTFFNQSLTDSMNKDFKFITPFFENYLGEEIRGIVEEIDTKMTTSNNIPCGDFERSLAVQQFNQIIFYRDLVLEASQNKNQ